ncbi:unnamed protein product [Dovyalis caffra]|uniref:Pseudouridine-5'-phosphate glycosidase n=1 Tax=Dovyalis caffra TaxID=77055 RepID=A0AAV1RAQ0_9ROSI|nr:unnamed protein product [Dovyalis caffra]
MAIQERLVKLSPEVAEALSSGNPVVALESTIISHGMPYPKNLETAKEVEAIVRENGAVPATIAILDGVACVVNDLDLVKVKRFATLFVVLALVETGIERGLSMGELERLATLGTKAQKTARRDIAHVVATRGNGATTVSATMFFASMVGIHVFVTGGIGGVHRHSEETMDISSDLTELGRTPVAVISAGVKSILDIPRTLEYLETQGVCVATYKTNEFPAFFTERSGCKVQLQCIPTNVLGLHHSTTFPNVMSDDKNSTPCYGPLKFAVAFNLIYKQWFKCFYKDVNLKVKLGTGILIAVPIPKEHSASGGLIESAIQSALREARDKNITGNAETPFLLAKVNELTGGASLASSILSLTKTAKKAKQMSGTFILCKQLQQALFGLVSSTFSPSVPIQPLTLTWTIKTRERSKVRKGKQLLKRNCRGTFDVTNVIDVAIRFYQIQCN